MKTTSAKRRRKPSAEKIRAAKLKRAELAALSRGIKQAMELGAFSHCATVSEALLPIYAKDTSPETSSPKMTCRPF